MTPLRLATDVRRLVVVGAGGFAREVAQWAAAAWEEAPSRLAGFVASRPSDSSKSLPAPYLGTPEEFPIEEGDRFLLGIGAVQWRRRVAESLRVRGARFIGLVHPTAFIAPTARLGEGVVVCPFAIVSDAAILGDFGLLNYYASMGHDATAGRYCVLSPYACLGGDAHVGDDVFLGMHASVGPGKRLGSRTKVSANSSALADTPESSLVYGVPGRLGYRFDQEG